LFNIIEKEEKKTSKRKEEKEDLRKSLKENYYLIQIVIFYKLII
jgi:hypothetical protein